MTASFRSDVFAIVAKIPKGKVLSYKQVAVLAGYPTSWRAVGNLLRTNRDVTIPCHRVVRSDGSIGGYNRGQDLKASLLKKESVVLLKNKKVVL